MTTTSYSSYLNINLTVLASKAFRAVANVTIYIIFTGSVILTRVRGTLVNIDLRSEDTTLHYYHLSLTIELSPGNEAP